MEEDFAGFILMTLICCFPFGFIYLVLNLLNWNERKNLFSDGWSVYLTWIISSLFGYVVCALVERKFFRHQSEFVALVSIIFLIILINICAIAGVLYLRTRKQGTSSITNYIDEKIQKPNIKKIWQTSAVVSISTLFFVYILIIAVNDIGERWKETPKKSDKLSFSI